MRPIEIPTHDVNSDTCVVVEWHAAEGERVVRDQLVVEVETSKAVIAIEAPGAGYLCHGFPQGAEVDMGASVAYLAEDEAAVRAFRAQRNAETSRAAEVAAARPYRATRKAEALAAQHGVDLASLDRGALITTKAVEQAIARQHVPDLASLPEPLALEGDVERVLILGGGLGATQVLDIFDGSPAQRAVALLDDDPATWGQEHRGVPVVGGSDRLAQLFEQGRFDAAVVSISTSIAVRTRLRELCERQGVPLANAIDRTCKIASDVRMGTGNVVCAFCHFGAGAVVGDNNFISAYNSFDHHCVLGSDLSTGPGCMASGLVRFGDRVRLGTGIFVEPHLSIGDDVRVASGAVILQSVPPDHVVKLRVGQTAIVPAKR